MEKLNREQRSRLVEVLSECLEDSSVRKVGNKVGCSFGYISEVASGTRKRITEDITLLICKGLEINPYYVLNGRGRKYKDWREAFNGKY